MPESPEPSVEHAGPRSPELQVGPRVGAVKPCSFASLVLKSLGGCGKPGREKRHVSGRLQSHLLGWQCRHASPLLAWGALSASFLSPPEMPTHQAFSFFYIHPRNPSVIRSLNLIAPQSFPALLLGRPAWIRHPTPVTPGQQTVEARPSTWRWILNVKLHFGGLLAAFSFPIRACPRCMSQQNETDLPLKSISFSAWLLTYLSHKTTSSLGKSSSQP